MTQLFANNVSVQILNTVNPGDTTIALFPGSGTLLPAITGSNFITATLNDYLGRTEIITITAISGDNITVTRAQEGTTALTWQPGNLVDLRITRDTLVRLQNPAANSVSFDGTTLDQQFLNRVNRVVDSIAELRTISKLTYTRCFVTGYYSVGDGGGGAYDYDPNDTTSADNGGTIIVATDGGRWKRLDLEFISAIDFGVKFDAATDGTSSFSNALTAASATVGNAQGNEVLLTQGTAILSSQQNIPNRVAIRGKNKRGSILKAAAGHPGPYMFTVVNGTSSMFDNPLEDLYLDCSDVAGLGGVISSAWQEGGGLRNVLINNFRTYGVRFQNGYGGASICEIDQAEIFGSNVAAATAGIQVDKISSIGSFLLRVTNSTIAGGSSFSLSEGINIVSDSLHAQTVHFENCTSGIHLDGPGHHVLIGVTGGSGVTNVVELSSTFTGTLKMLGCLRAGATNLLKDNRAGGYGTVSIDIDVDIRSQPIYGAGAVSSIGVFDGTLASPTITGCFGVSAITKNATGDYKITETTDRPSANAYVNASSNLAAGSITVDLIGAASYRIRTYNASNALADSNEIKFECKRIS